MNRLVDYKLTEEEVRQIFGFQESYEFALKVFDENPDSDSEKLKIAHLLFRRGMKKESLKVISTINDERYRCECERDYIKWEGKEEGVYAH